ncbi:RDD family protein [Mycobacterium sp. Y57]|nr:RDD family protein [Mycolicibacterium xanthum]
MPDPARAAGIVSRSVAAVIDLCVVGVLLGMMYVGLLLALLAVRPGAFQLPAMDLVFSGAVVFGAAVTYLAACWSVSGCTAGAVVMGLQVVGRGGSRLKPHIALLRGVGYVVFPIGLAWVAVDPRRRSLQDIVLGTRVVYARR